MQKIIKFVGLALALLSFPRNEALAANLRTCARSISEYLLPPAEETHEILHVPQKNMLLITQLTSSKLIKAQTDASGEIISVRGFLIGHSTSGLHGIASSVIYSNEHLYWVGLENNNTIILLDPVLSDLDSTPEMKQVIPIPSPGNGPHHLAEYGTNIWATLKGSNHVLRIGYNNQSDYELFETLPRPIFLAQHPISKDIYVSEFKSNSILRINHDDNTMSRIQVPPEVGESPVGIVSNANFTWVALLSVESKGKGSFGKIYPNGTVKWYRLKTELGKKAAIIHIAFNPDELTEEKPRVWLLASSAENPAGFDMILKSNFDKNYDDFDMEQIAFLPSQGIRAHRVVATLLGFYVTELTNSRVAFYKRTSNKTSCQF